PNIEHICILGDNRDRFENLRKLLAAEKPKRAIVFVNNNTEMDVLTSKLIHHKVNAIYISGKSSKEDRKRAIDSFKSGKCPVLVSSDLSARGLDIPDVTHIINLDFPGSSNEYLHRAGRTARGLGSGKAISLITVKEIKWVNSYEKEFKIKFIPARLYMGKLERLD
ncbi:C-terminal helicase domain-containing protein, partial [Clostridium saudiense]|nr:C-terminal helicase domain-containing protein [Clostridium saudiense]